MTEPIGRVMGHLRSARDLRWRRPPRLRMGAGGGIGTIYYLTPHLNAASGGVRNMYRHVDLLNAAGFPAAVLHAKAGFRCDWFDNQTRIAYPDQVTFGPEDVLVVAECYGPFLDLLPPELRTVVFNQGAYHTFDLIPYDQTPPGAPYSTMPNLAALMVVSQDNLNLLGYAYPQVPIHLTRVVVDGSVFHPGPAVPGRRIAYLTHRRPEEREQLRHLLRARGALSGWELVAIEGRPEREVAQLLRESAIFLSFSERDGFGLPPAEAMASGSYVVGYTGMGGREFFDPSYCTPVPDSDLLAFAQAVTDAIGRYEDDPQAFAKLGRSASERILGHYHPDGLTEDLRRAYQELR